MGIRFAYCRRSSVLRRTALFYIVLTLNTNNGNGNEQHWEVASLFTFSAEINRQVLLICKTTVIPSNSPEHLHKILKNIYMVKYRWKPCKTPHAYILRILTVYLTKLNILEEFLAYNIGCVFYECEQFLLYFVVSWKIKERFF